MALINAKINIMTEHEEQLIHDSSMVLLQKHGLYLPNKHLLERASSLGDQVDFQSRVVKISEHRIESILKLSAQKGKTYQKETVAMHMPVTPQPCIIDLESKSRRYGIKSDLLDGFAVSKNLKNMDSISPIVIPSDVPSNITDVVSYSMMYSYLENPGNTYINNLKSMEYVFELADISGHKPFLLVEPTTPLHFSETNLLMALKHHDKGFPVGVGPMVVAGFTAPITLAGTLVWQNADVLASIYLLYLLGEKDGFVYGAGALTSHPREAITSFGSPNQVLLNLGEKQMADRYGLPTYGILCLSDALFPDFQSGFEKGFSAAFAASLGMVGIGNQGFTGGEQGASLEQLIIDDEWLSMINYVLRGFKIDEDRISLSSFEYISDNGECLSSEHSSEYYKENFWNSALFQTTTWEGFEATEKKQIWQRANHHVKDILSKSLPLEPILSNEQLKEIDRVLESAYSYATSE